MTDRPTMKDVARAAGVSPMTVSRVIRQDHRVAPENVAKVNRAIAELGYQRDDAARQLRSAGGPTQMIGLLLDNLADPFMASFADAAEQVARDKNYLLLVGCSHNEEQRARAVLDAFTSRRVDGLILIPVAMDHGFLRRAMERGTRVVCADRPAPGLLTDTVTVNNRDATRAAVEHLISRGHHRIAYLGDVQTIWTIEERHAGYLEALAAHGIRPDPTIVRHGLRNRDDAAAAAKGLFARPDPPTAVLAGNDVAAIGALRHLPRRVAMVSFDDFVLADQHDPPLSVIARNPAEIGEIAANRLFARIGGDRSPIRSTVLNVEFIAGDSDETLGPFATQEQP